MKNPFNRNKNSLSGNSVVAGGVKENKYIFWKYWSKKRKIIVFTLVLLIVSAVAISAVLYLKNENRTTDAKIKAANIISDDSQYDDQTINQFIKDSTKDPNYSAGKNLSISNKTNYQTAVALGVAFDRIGDFNNALKAYAVAETKLTSDKLETYEFYRDYGDAASSINQRDVAIQAYTKAKEAFLQSSASKENQAYTQKITSGLDAMIKDLKAGTN